MEDTRALKRFIQLKIYGNGRILNDQEAVDKELAALEEEDLSRSFEGCRRPSAYVEVFESGFISLRDPQLRAEGALLAMINLVFDGPEKYLLSPKEWLPLSAIKNMSCK